ncbi:hypothetical protein PACILC2_22970 [Paenibacillus cisolokensis]|uniref:Copper amine oxidase-like N-terminal domain-containing protein n=1 Tax=Paenibacillus cisolokensis TaxID=1658519 RepID=A0ABQ4N696_9BACL|nr:hypothetical protein [Paenibacillus cisolokensis]GIQ63729.1 hypothetical protein PACILC2_22970 [Paenibacillus cisolokensis]
MKKIIAGIVGFSLLLVGTSVSASVIKDAIIGKKVDGVAKVIVDGKALETNAITINGTSYVPVRALTEAVGGKVVRATSGTIELKTESGDTVNPEIMAKKSNLETEINSRKREIEKAKERLALNQSIIDNTDELVTTNGKIPFEETEQYAKIVAEMERDQAKIKQLEAEIAELEAQLAALE